MNDNNTQHPFKHCPRCGQAPFEDACAKSRRCAVCGFEFFFNPAAAVAALIVDDTGRLLIVVRAHDPGAGLLDLPGGFADPGETAEQAICREVKEELNLDIEQTDYFLSVPNQYPYKGMVYDTLDLAFICHVKNFDNLKPQDEIKEVLFLSPDEINIEQFAFDSIRRMVKQFVEAR
jgi:mutator protein MutT